MNQSRSSPNIIVMGIGDGGINAIDRIASFTSGDMTLVSIDTDSQVLQASKADLKIQIGKKLTNGRGTGGNVETGAQAAEDAREKVEDLARSADMVFLTSSFGGGTGTGATPVIGSMCSEIGVLTVGVVTTPFPFEGTPRTERAEGGIHKLEQSVDALIVVSNERLLESLPKDTSMIQAFASADRVLQRGVQGISDLITRPGLINLDLADIRNVLQGVGRAVIGIGTGGGEEKAIEAGRQALNNPLLEGGSIKGARRLILNITGGEDLTLDEVREVAEFIRKSTGTETSMIFGAVVRENYSDEVIITLIATDFGKNITDQETEPPLNQSAIDFADLNVPAFLRKQYKNKSSNGNGT